MHGQSTAPWWHSAVIYQVYVPSFQDTNDDAVGDLAGIRRRLDYLESLGIDAIWITPIFPSPLKDLGYDVSDYCAVHPTFGDMAEFDRLVGDVHSRGMRLIVDFVPNHTSSEHAWFRQSRSSRDNPCRDWYLWHDPAPDGGPPNNWLSVFGGSAWELDEATGQYYYHAFLKDQPDLNWRSADVQKGMLDVMRFWLDRGVDGFRVDVIWHLIKDAQWRDNPVNAEYDESQLPYDRLKPVYSTDQPEVHDIVHMMRNVVDEYSDKLLIGEVYLPIEELVAYYGVERSGAHLPFNFQLIVLPWHARTIAAAVDEYEASLPDGAWPNWVLGNHDKPRIATRAGAGQARVAAMLLLTLRGTPTMYYGDEIGMTDVDVPPERRPQVAAFDVSGRHGRLPHRTPMRWDEGPHAGFSKVDPWLPVGADAGLVNVSSESRDSDSVLTFYRRLLALRRAEPALAIGAYRPIPTEEDDIIAYIREHDGRRLLVTLNLGHAATSLDVPELRGEVVLSTRLDRAGEAIDRRVTMRPDEGLVTALRVASQAP